MRCWNSVVVPCLFDAVIPAIGACSWQTKDYQVAEIIKALGIPEGIAFFEEFDDDRKKDIFECFNKEWMADILEEMAPDERADFLKHLSEEKTEEILPLVARAERLDIKKLMNYEKS